MPESETLTPMMQQFRAAKEQHPGMLVLFRNGDFYELFEDDAEFGARILGLTLTKRDKEIPMAGFPHHKLEHYLNLLLKAGHRVAVCEQMEQPQAGKKIIRREVNRVVTPGTVTEDELLDPRQANHIVALMRSNAGVYGLAWADLSTGEFAASDLSEGELTDEIARLDAVECLLPEDVAGLLQLQLGTNPPRTIVPRPTWTFDASTAIDALQTHFKVKTFSGFGFDDGQPCLRSAGALLFYMGETLKASLDHIRRIRPRRADGFLILDETTRRSLELTRTLRDNQRDGSLLSIIDRTITPMGARLLHDSLLAPLNRRAEIEARHEAVAELHDDHPFRNGLRQLLEATSDLQRLATRAGTARANPKDLAAIARTLRLLPEFKAKLACRRSPLLNDLEKHLDLCPEVRHELDTCLTDDPPYNPKDGGIIRPGFNKELDELRKLSREGIDWIANYQAQEVTRTGITSLKVGFTDVMGYYIEITNANETRAPNDYTHERTLKNCKRYSTPALKEYEEKVVTAQERSQALELELFMELRDRVAFNTHRMLQTADVLAMSDMLASLAELAASRNYVRPAMVDVPVLQLQEARHPVLDQTLQAGSFVPNDALFGPVDGMFWLITGPNMSGKSTFIRQVALITLLAHVGSFVPAESAKVGITDRIFTRVGASDELSRGQSTFMVEMTEAANILNNATSRSLVILDEIGRGTSTYDGLSLAWAITEHLHDVVGSRTLFATHYHELAQLSATLPRLRNHRVEVEELDNEVIFLHKIMPGNADKSYGIHVARLAGVPESVLNRAEEVLDSLEQQPTVEEAKPRKAKPKRPQRVIEPPEGVKPQSPSLFGEEE